MSERNWVRLKKDAVLKNNLILKSKILSGIRSFFEDAGFIEIDPPSLVHLPGMEPHLEPLAVRVTGQMEDKKRFFLHTSPEYALKKLLTGGLTRIYAMGHVFRNGEISATHNPEFMMIEWYRAGADYRDLMDDCEALVLHLAEKLGLKSELTYLGLPIRLERPWPRIEIPIAFREYAGVDLDGIATYEALVESARKKGYDEIDSSWPWEDVFYKIYFHEVEPHLPKDRPYFLTDYPVEMGALARKKPSNPRYAERFELYAGGLELANAFSELTDPEEQGERLSDEQRQRADQGCEAFPVDVTFLEALRTGMPSSAGIALGVDRLVMLLLDAPTLRDVLPFPMEDLLQEWETVHGKDRREE